VQRAAVATGGDLALGRRRLCSREIRRDGDERVDPWLGRRDAREAGFGQLGG
jgi:hypothetical protein